MYTQSNCEIAVTIFIFKLYYLLTACYLEMFDPKYYLRRGHMLLVTVYFKEVKAEFSGYFRF